MSEIDIYWLRHKLYLYLKDRLDNSDLKTPDDGVDLCLTGLSAITGIDFAYHFQKKGFRE